MKSSFAKNFATSILNFVLSALIGFFFTPYLLKTLGVAAYGLYPLALQLTNYMGVITLALNSSAARFMTVAKEQGDDDRAERVFNTTLFGGFALAGLLSLIGGVVVWNLESIVQVPTELLTEARVLFGCCIMAFTLNQAKTAFDAVTFCKNRFEIRNAISILETALRAGIPVVLFTVLAPDLKLLGYGVLATAIVSAIWALFWWQRLMPELRVRSAQFDPGLVRELGSVGGWAVINQIGALLFLSIDLFVVNRVLGPIEGGIYATLIVWPTLVRTMANYLAAIFTPTFVKYQAAGDYEGMANYADRTVRTMGAFVALPVGLVAGLASPLLSAWVGEDFVQYGPLVTLMTIHLSINLGVMPLFGIQTATAKLKVPGLVMLAAGVVNLLLASYLTRPEVLGMAGVALSGAIVLSFKNAIFTPLYISHILGQSRSRFFGAVIAVAVATLLSAGTAFGLSQMLSLSGWRQVVVCGGISALVYLPIGLAVLSPGDRDKLLGRVKRVLRR